MVFPHNQKDSNEIRMLDQVTEFSVHFICQLKPRVRRKLFGFFNIIIAHRCLTVRVIWIKYTELCTSIRRSLSKENHKRKTKNGEKKLTMKVMWPPNNKVNESITKVTVTKKNCVSQRRKWKLYNANVFSNQKKKESVDSFAWPFHTRLQFKFFGMRGFFGQCNVFFFFHFKHMNAIAVAYEYVMTLYFFSLFQHFFHSHIYPLVRALRHIDFRFAVYRYSRDECGEALSNGTAHTFLSCIVLSAEFIIILLLSTRVRRAFTFYFRRIHLVLFVWLLYPKQR